MSFEVLGPTALGIAEGLAGVTLPQVVFREGGEGRLPLGLAGRRDTVSRGCLTPPAPPTCQSLRVCLSSPAVEEPLACFLSLIPVVTWGSDRANPKPGKALEAGSARGCGGGSAWGSRREGGLPPSASRSSQQLGQRTEGPGAIRD